MTLSAVISGVGQTEYAKHIERDVEQLAIEATIAAAGDAGITVESIDGFIPYPGHVEPEVIMSTLGMNDVKFTTMATIGGASAVSALGIAALAVEQGLATNVLLYRALKGNSGLRKRDPNRRSYVPGERKRQQLELTAGMSTPAQRYSLFCRRFMLEHKLTREHLGEVALAARAHANLNPNAQMFDRTLSMDEYKASRPISDPYLLFDCCLETDGACAVIVSAGASAGGSAPVEILGVEEGHPPQPDDIPSRKPFLETGLERAARRLWARTGLRPSDMDAAMIYDCFTFEALHQLQAAGFVAADELGEFVASGQIRLGGSLPMNTHGGALSEAHLAGLNHVIEAVNQLRGACGPRQVTDAKRIAVTGWGNLGDGSIAVLGADDNG